MASQDYSQPFHGHYTVLDDAEFQVRGRTLFFVVVVFIVILLIVVVLLYSRWVCRSQHFPTSSHAPHAPPPPPQGLDPALIRGLPIVLHQSAGTDLGPDLEAGGGGECCICLGVFEDGEKVKVLPICRHCYHSECVDAWLRAHSSCPLCRASLQTHSQVQPTVVQ